MPFPAQQGANAVFVRKLCTCRERLAFRYVFPLSNQNKNCCTFISELRLLRLCLAIIVGSY